jgi:hypothetical protein
MDAIGKLVGFVVLLTFTIDCIISAARSSLAGERIRRLRAKRSRPRCGDKLRAESRQKTILALLSATLCLAAVSFTDVRIAKALNTGTVAPQIDSILTWILLFAGADRFRELIARLKGDASGSARKEVPAVRLAFENDGQVRALKQAV